MESANNETLSQPTERVKLEPQANKKYQDFLETRIIGQPEATEAFARLAVRIQSGIRNPSGIIDSKFLAGPSGVGKTETTLTLARLFDRTDGPPKVIKVDCGLLQQPHELSKLVGSPPGYVGSEGSSGYIEPVLSPENIERNTITYTDAQGKTQKLTIILFDEFEKAHPDLQKMLLVSLDKGTIQTASNRPVDLSNSVILFTSNIGNQRVEQQREANPIGFRQSHNQGHNQGTTDAREIVISEMEKVFPPEFRGRVNDVIIFRHLTKEAAVSITKIKLDELQDVFERNGITIRLNPSDRLLDYVAQNGLNSSEGSRAIIKLINEQISDGLISAHADFNINGHEIIIDIDDTGKPALYFGEVLEDKPKTIDVPNSTVTEKDTSSQAEENKALPKEPKEPIEQLHARLIAKLQDESRELDRLPDDDIDQPPIVRLMSNIQYIYKLSEKIPELKQYLRRWKHKIKIVSGSIPLTKQSIRLNYRSPVYEQETPFVIDYEGIELNLQCRPDMHGLLAVLTDEWDQGRKSMITKLGKLTKKNIVKDILKLKKDQWRGF